MTSSDVIPGPAVSFEELLQRSAGAQPSAVALRHGERVVSHPELARRVRSLAEGLRGLGVESGDRIGVVLRNSPELLELFLAAAISEAVLVPVNYRLAQPEMRWILDDVEPRVVVLGQGFGTLTEMIAELAASPVVVGVDDGLGPDAILYESLLEQPTSLLTPEPEMPVMISYTGGTTGVPKGVVLTQAGFLASMRQEIPGLSIGRETLLAAMPLFHIGIVHALTVLSLGGEVILLERVDLAEVCEHIERYRVTMTVLLPTSVVDLLALEDHDLSSLRRLLYGGAPMPQHAAARASQRFGQVLIGVYGLTESGGVAAALLGPDHDAQEPEGELSRLTSVGRALPGVIVQCCDPETGAPLPTGEEGEIVITTPATMTDYWRRVELTDEAIREGRLHTGDIGVIDHRGYIFLRDRKSNMIITGGENVYPREVEDALLAHPFVLEAGVLGMPDSRWGESVTAFVATHPEAPSSEVLIDFCRGLLAGYKCPKRIVFVDRLPRSVVGKIDKRALRALALDGERPPVA